VAARISLQDADWAQGSTQTKAKTGGGKKEQIHPMVTLDGFTLTPGNRMMIIRHGRWEVSMGEMEREEEKREDEPEQVSPKIKKIRLDDFYETFGIPDVGKVEIDSIGVYIREIANENIYGDIVGLNVQNAMASIGQSLALGNITCNEIIPSSSMQAIYRNKKVVFRCYHTPTHEFEIQV
jgi:hypothetical protein